MAPKTHEVLIYQDHKGTIRVSGTTNPANCAAKAVRCLEEEGVQNIDFLCIGAEANQATTKAMTLFRFFQEENTNGEFSLAFTPFHVYTLAENRREKNGPKTKLTATVWRTILLSADQTSKLMQLNPS